MYKVEVGYAVQHEIMQFNAKNTFCMFLRRDEAKLRNTSDTTKTSQYKT